jgi:cell division topological specificity factor
MSDWLSKLSGRPNSAEKAKDRLKLVLIHDRTDITTSSLEEMKDKIIKVISEHISIDPDLVKIQMVHEGREQRLIADIPIKPRR